MEKELWRWGREECKSERVMLIVEEDGRQVEKSLREWIVYIDCHVDKRLNGS